jgi:hypothetical protein
MEKPIRKLPDSARKQLAFGLSCLIAIFLGLGLTINREIISAFSYRQGEEIKKISEAFDDWDFPGRLVSIDTEKGIRYREQGVGSREIVFIGDSHMEHYYPKAEALLIEKYTDHKIIFLTQGGCPPLQNVKDGRDKVEDCPKQVAFSFSQAAKNGVGSVVISAAWDSYFSQGSKYFLLQNGEIKLSEIEGMKHALISLEDSISKLVRSGKKVFLVLSSPSGKEFSPANKIIRTLSLSPVVIFHEPYKLSSLDERRKEIREALREVGASAGAKVIDPYEHLCDRFNCATHTSDGKPIYKDGKHFRPFYVKEDVTYLDQVFL